MENIPEQQTKEKYPIWLNIWAWWIFFSFVYGIYEFIFPSTLRPEILPLLARVIGLFVPFAGWNTFVSLVGLFGIPIIIFVLILSQIHKIDKVLYFSHKNSWTMLMIIFFNLAFLLSVTALVDILIWNCWESMNQVFGTTCIYLQIPPPPPPILGGN